MSVLVDKVRDQSPITNRKMKMPNRHHDSLAQISINVRELNDRHLRTDGELLSHDPLRPTTARAQHEDRWHFLRGLILKLTGRV